MTTPTLQSKFVTAKKRELFIPHPAVVMDLKDKPNVRPRPWLRPRPRKK